MELAGLEPATSWDKGARSWEAGLIGGDRLTVALPYLRRRRVAAAVRVIGKLIVIAEIPRSPGGGSEVRGEEAHPPTKSLQLAWVQEREAWLEVEGDPEYVSANFDAYVGAPRRRSATQPKAGVGQAIRDIDVGLDREAGSSDVRRTLRPVCQA